MVDKVVLHLSADTKKQNMLYQAGLGKELGAVLFTNSISLLLCFTKLGLVKSWVRFSLPIPKLVKP